MRSWRSPVRSRLLPSSHLIHVRVTSGPMHCEACSRLVAPSSRSVRYLASSRLTIGYATRCCGRECRAGIDRAFVELNQLAREYGKGRIGLDVNIVIAGPGTNRESAVDDAVQTARFALMAGAAWGIRVDLNLHPYYPGARGLARFPDHPRASLATTVEVITRITALVRSTAVDTTLFIGWNDEGHDSERRQRRLEMELTGAGLRRFQSDKRCGSSRWAEVSLIAVESKRHGSTS